MSYVIRLVIDKIFECLKSAFAMLKTMSALASSKEHLSSTKRIILHKVGQLYRVMKNMHNLRPKASAVDIIGYLMRRVEVKIELHATISLFQGADWAAVDGAISSAYKPLDNT